MSATVDEELAQRNRWAVRQLASGVAVLTVGDVTPAHGTTVSAVTTVSRVPLLIGACLRHDSLFLRLLAERGRFAVSVLRAEQEYLAKWFGNPGRPRGLAQFDPVDWEPDGYSGAPLLRGSLAYLGCRLRDELSAGDHRLLVAEVVTGIAGEGSPLLSFAGGLHDGGVRAEARQPLAAARS